MISNMAPPLRLHCALLLALLAAPLICQLSPAAAQSIALPVTQRSFSADEVAAQVATRAAYFRNVADASSDVSRRSLLAATPGMALGGGFLTQFTFTVDVKVGTPPVTLPLIVDTGSHGPKYDPASSTTALSNATCDQCAAGGLGATGCLGAAYSTGCQFEIQNLNRGAAGPYLRDVVALGSVSTGTARIFLGTSIFQYFNDSNAGQVGFGPAGASLPAQLKQVGALTTTTFGLCLASGFDTGGTLFLGGVPTQPGGANYAVSYTTPPINTNSPFWSTPAPTNVLLNGAPVPGAAAALTADTGATWILDSTPRLAPLELYARFPVLTIQLPGTQIVARPKSYITPLDPNNEQISIGIFDGGPNDAAFPDAPPVRKIGPSFTTDNLVVYDADNKRVGSSSMNCNTLRKLPPQNRNFGSFEAPALRIRFLYCFLFDLPAQYPSEKLFLVFREIESLNWQAGPRKVLRLSRLGMDVSRRW
ncbi:hypothetical protein KFL_000260450 [Klebsormidium nitens]|uniref:Peptidase A1 domain-containing protein n=1 Tax=Klebsormidium nitens TaxID=105231 RepID=A0A1Y1HPU2_KLENI|nr:hypothetical protein KFL_000260450 [Klebsormidium nitens]|eukprot:GAQ79229.1 hypothetical protein KFL_000260450 [Klebsormidium nitens]